jgi:hypothetical protein
MQTLRTGKTTLLIDGEKVLSDNLPNFIFRLTQTARLDDDEEYYSIRSAKEGQEGCLMVGPDHIEQFKTRRQRGSDVPGDNQWCLVFLEGIDSDTGLEICP